MSAHPHSAFIAEALQDTSREIEVYADDEWCPCELKYVLNATHPNAGAHWQFRFKPTKPAVVSTLSDDELSDIGSQHWEGIRPHTDFINSARAIANAATAEERKRICSLPAVSLLTPRGGGYSTEQLIKMQNETIAQFLKDIEEGKI